MVRRRKKNKEHLPRPRSEGRKKKSPVSEIYNPPLRNEVGDKDLQQKRIESKVVNDSYKIIKFHGSDLPKEYHNVIISKWIRSLRRGNKFFSLIDADSYYNSYQKYIKNILSKGCVWLAVLSCEPDVVLGFSVSRGTILDYVHVLRAKLARDCYADFRRNGIGSKLIPPNIESFTHITNDWLSIWPKKFGHWKFNPFA